MSLSPVTLSVLDQSPIRAGGTAAQAISETVELARAVERWGYHRYWWQSITLHQVSLAPRPRFWWRDSLVRPARCGWARAG